MLGREAALFKVAKRRGRASDEAERGPTGFLVLW